MKSSERKNVSRRAIGRQIDGYKLALEKQGIYVNTLIALVRGQIDLLGILIQKEDTLTKQHAELATMLREARTMLERKLEGYAKLYK